jgi:DNA-binding MarR family transcriptional regulator
VVPGQFAQLLALYQTDGLTQAELCTRVQIEQPTMANTLARMERDGLITRTPDPADQRRALVRLTEHARRLEPDLLAAARAVNDLATQGLTDEEITTFQAARDSDKELDAIWRVQQKPGARRSTLALNDHSGHPDKIHK